MKCKDCKITCDGKEVATISCTGRGFTIKPTEAGKKMHAEMLKGCCE